MSILWKVLLCPVELWARIFYRYRAEGVENIPLEGPYIIVLNHPGKLLVDGFFAWLAILKRRTPVVIIPSLLFRLRRRGHNWFVLILRYVPKFLRAIRVRRGGDTPAASKQMMLDVLREGHAIFLTPEGEVSWHGRLNPLRPGAASIALRAHVPIVPVGISGSYDIWPRWAARPHLTGKITVRVGKPFYLGDAPLDRDKIEYALLEQSSARIRDEISKLLD